MTYSSSLINEARPLVLDTSVLINLHACTYGERILTTIANDIIVPEIVAQELEHEMSRKNGEHSFLHSLVASGKVTIAGMTDEELDLFSDLVRGSPSLDDGEAATIAIAVKRELPPIIDERKGRARATALMSGKEPGWTLDLFLHPQVPVALGSIDVAEAVFLALRNARMRIHEHQCDHVVDLIGTLRALECHSLPSYKLRRPKWRSSD